MVWWQLCLTMIVLLVCVLSMLGFLAWLAKYWNVFEDKEQK